jgi:hypothetical protein
MLQVTTFTPRPPECPNCLGSLLSLNGAKHNASSVLDGRLKMNDIHATVYVACEECSETIAEIDLDEFLALAEKLLTVNQVLLLLAWMNPKEAPLDR